MSAARIASAAAAGGIFAVGLEISGMARPEKVRGFLDVTRAWDPSLLCVMVGAVGVYMLAFRFIRRRERPVLADRFHLPTKTEIDGRLVVGATLFGVGWGIGGFCPGPALVTAGSALVPSLVFVAAMTVTFLVAHALPSRS